MGVVSTYTTLMLESKKCIFFCHLQKSTPLNLSSLAKLEAMCFIEATSIDLSQNNLLCLLVVSNPDQGEDQSITYTNYQRWLRISP
ncbi:hypothetical protein Tco_0861857 [Tanacetum coccineum]